MKNYLYLVTSNNRFKVGITSNPKKRNYQYKAHNLDYKFEGIFEVKNKNIEKYIHWNLLKIGYKRCKNYKEWFEGTYSLFLLKNDIEDYNNKIFLKDNIK